MRAERPRPRAGARARRAVAARARVRRRCAASPLRARARDGGDRRRARSGSTADRRRALRRDRRRRLDRPPVRRRRSATSPSSSRAYRAADPDFAFPGGESFAQQQRARRRRASTTSRRGPAARARRLPPRLDPAGARARCTGTTRSARDDVPNGVAGGARDRGRAPGDLRAARRRDVRARSSSRSGSSTRRRSLQRRSTRTPRLLAQRRRPHATARASASGSSSADDVTVDVVDADGDAVAHAARRPPLGRATAGCRAALGRPRRRRRAARPTGVYRMRVTLRDQGRTVVIPQRRSRIDTTPPRPRVAVDRARRRATAPSCCPSPAAAPRTIRFAPALGKRRKIMIFRTAPGRAARWSRPRRSRPGATPWRLGRHATTRAPRLARAPTSPSPQWRDHAGNVGTLGPARTATALPILRHGKLPGRGGITVRYLGAQPPVTPVKARDRVEIDVDARGERYALERAPRRRRRDPRARAQPKTRPTFALPRAGRQVGGSTSSRRARARAHARRVTVQARQPVAGTPAKPRGVLVVLPYDHLAGPQPGRRRRRRRAQHARPRRARRAPVRVMAGDGLPQGFARAGGPTLLRWLDRNGQALRHHHRPGARGRARPAAGRPPRRPDPGRRALAAARGPRRRCARSSRRGGTRRVDRHRLAAPQRRASTPRRAASPSRRRASRPTCSARASAPLVQPRPPT